MKHTYKYILLIFALFLSVQIASAQKTQDKDITIHGNVKSDKGLPLMGVTVTVQDSFIDAETDELGDFEITVPKKGAVLVFNADYFQEVFQQVTSDGYLQIIMKDAVAGQGVGDYVNRPWRTDRQRSITGSVATTHNEQLRKSPVMSLGNALAGRVSGLYIRQLAGLPGFDEATIMVRGTRTLYDGAYNAMTVGGSPNPLIIVDGFERNFSELDASEIESFSVLKDVSATALYGMRAANGVILVNTKRGQLNRRTVDLDISSGIVTPTNLPHYLDAYNYASLYNEARHNDGLENTYSDEDLALYKSGASPLTHPNVNFYDEFIKNYAYQKKASLTMRGGNKIVRYFVALAYNSQDGLFAHTNENADFSTNISYNKYNLRSNIDVNVTDWLTVSADVAGRIEDRRYPSIATADILQALMTPSNAYPISFKGIEPTLNKEILMLGGNSLYKNNPLGYLSYSGYNENTRRYYQVTAKAKADLSEFITKGLSVEASYYMDGYNLYRVEKSRNFLVWQYSKLADGTNKYTSFGQETSLATSGYYDVDRYNGLDANIKYNREFGKHGVNAMLLYNQQTTEFRQNNQSDMKYQNYAFYANYSYNNKYFIDVTGSYMGSDRFYDTNNRRLFYPAVGAAWIISGEDFMKGTGGWLDYLKLRGSFGIVGNGSYAFEDVNGNDERYPARQRWWTSSGQQYFGTSLTSAITVREGRFDNPNVTVEKSRMLNVALEGTLLNHRLNFTAEYWKDHRYDIYTVGVGSTPWIIGLMDNRLPIGNEGIVNTSGVEFSLGWNDHIGGFRYSVNGFFNWWDSEIIAMAEPYKEYDNLLETGRRVRQDYGYISLGLFKDWDDVNNSPTQTFGPYQPGDIKYKDLNGDNIIDSNDLTAIGDGLDYRMSFALDFNFAYKGFDLSLLFQGVSCKSNYLNGDSFRAFYDNGGITEVALGRYRMNDDGSNNYATATYPRLTTLSNDNNWRASTFWMYDGSYLRLKNAELGYSIPEKLLKKSQVSGIRVYLNAYNAYTWSYVSKLGYDPEDVAAGTSRYPQVRVFNLGINLTF